MTVAASQNSPYVAHSFAFVSHLVNENQGIGHVPIAKVNHAETNPAPSLDVSVVDMEMK